MVHHLKAQRRIGPINGGHVEEQVEGELRLETGGHREQGVGGKLEHEDAMLHPHGRTTCTRYQLFGDAIEKRRGHGQNDSFTMRCLPVAIFSCSCMMPSITISGRGGHPGT